LGGLAGIVGFAPLLLMSDVIQKRFIKRGSKALKHILVAPLISFVLMLVALIVFWYFASQYLIIFAVVCVAVFLMSSIVYTVVQVKKVS